MPKPVKLSESTVLFVLKHLDQGGHIRWEIMLAPNIITGAHDRRVRKLTIFGTDFPLMYTILSRAFDILSAKRLIACSNKTEMPRIYTITPLGKQALKAGVL